MPPAKQKFLKFRWEEQCQLLKEQSISTHRDWLTAGKPRVGPVASAMRSAKAEYKLYQKHKTINQSINQSRHISIAPYVASESEAHSSTLFSTMEVHNHFSNDLHKSIA